MNYISAKAAAQKWGISQRRVHQYCKSQRIEGVKKLGNAWAIPEDAEKPEDPRQGPRELDSNTGKRINRKKTGIRLNGYQMLHFDNKLEDGVKKKQRVGAVIAAAGITDTQEKISPLMNLGATSIIRRIVLIFQQAGVSPIVVVTGHQALEIEQHLNMYGIIFIRNDAYDSTDKFSSIKLGLDFLKNKCDKIFINSVKVPVFTPNTLRRMSMEDKDVIIPSFQGKGGHPILVSSAMAKEMLEFQGKGGMREAIAVSSYEKHYIAVEDEGILLTTENIERLDEMIPEHNAQLWHPFVKISIERELQFFDSRAKILLQLIQETHSVQSACKQIAMSKGKAWDIINTMEKQLGFEVVNRRQGGSYGGKTDLTPKGEAFLITYIEFEDRVRRFASEQFIDLFKYF